MSLCGRPTPLRRRWTDLILLTSAFGVMFFGDPVAAFANMRRAACPGARMAFVCWRPLAENPLMEVPMNAVSRQLPPRPKPERPRNVRLRRSGARIRGSHRTGWAPPRLNKPDLDLDIAGRGWRRLWCSQPRSAPLAAGCATSLRRASQSRSRPSARRCGASGPRERAPARCDVAGQQRVYKSACGATPAVGKSG